jgi:hypothetical protein
MRLGSRVGYPSNAFSLSWPFHGSSGNIYEPKKGGR